LHIGRDGRPRPLTRFSRCTRGRERVRVQLGRRFPRCACDLLQRTLRAELGSVLDRLGISGGLSDQRDCNLAKGVERGLVLEGEGVREEGGRT
jgi:hypothetical protein